MKNLIKNSLKTVAICLLLVLSSCEAEKDFADKSANQTIIKRVSLKNMSNNSNPKLFKAVNQIKDLQTTNIESKITFDEKSGLYFDDEKGIYIKKEELESYTFPVFNTVDDKIRNICFNLNQNGEYDTYLVKYNFTKTEFENLTKEELAQREVVDIPIVKDGVILSAGRMSCIYVQALTQLPYPIDQGEGNFGYLFGWHIIAHDCTYISDNYSPTDPEDTDGGFNNGAGDGSSSTGGDTGGGVSADEGIITGSIVNNTEAQIVGSMPIELAIEYFENHLDPETQLPIYNDYPELRDYLLNHNCNDEARAFALDMIGQISMDPGIFSSIKPMVIEKQIDDSQLDPCTKAILDRVKDLTQNDISKIINRFDNESPIFNINLIKGSLPSTFPTIRFGNTNYNSFDDEGNGIPNNYKITLNENYFKDTKGTKLFKAAVIMHEMIHALMYSVIDDNNAGILSSQAEFPEVWNQYINTKSSQHEFMANYYVTIISEALKELDNNNHPQQLYTDLAWFGLESLNIFETTTSLTDEDRIRITGDRLWAEAANLPTATVQPSTPPCN